MYTAIREPDGSLFFALHVPPERLTRAEARCALSALGDILGDLRRQAGHVRVPDPSRRPGPRPRRKERSRRRPTAAPATAEP